MYNILAHTNKIILSGDSLLLTSKVLTTFFLLTMLIKSTIKMVLSLQQVLSAITRLQTLSATL